MKCKKYSVMLGLVSCLVSLLTVGLYFMSDNVVTLSGHNVVTLSPDTKTVVNTRSFIYQPSQSARPDRATTWRDFNQVHIPVNSSKIVLSIGFCQHLNKTNIKTGVVK